MRPKLLDLFCGAGGAAMGYSRAGFDVVGVDINPQPRYPFEFIQADAMTFPLDGFDAIHASPPCQGYSIMRNLPWLRDREYPMLIPDVRERLQASGVPWVIENVAGAKRSVRHPEGLQAQWLCGQMFDLPIFRHRYFETSFLWLQPGHTPHTDVIQAGHTLGARARVPVRPGGQVYGFDRTGNAVGHGNSGGLSARDALGVPWMSRDEATQAIPPQMTEFIGKQLMEALMHNKRVRV
jgi:DNA (cytosine-5)-methyltransferase 1